MTEQRHTAAFIVGSMLGGLAGAGLALWKTPMRGEEIRARLAEKLEAGLFSLTEVGERVRATVAPAPATEPPLMSMPLIEEPPVWEPPPVETPPQPEVPVVDLVPPNV